MFMHRLNKLAIAAAILAGAASSAQATVTLSFVDGANSVSCTTTTGTCTGAGAAAFTVISSFDILLGAKIEVVATNWFGWNLGGILGGSSTTASYGVTEAVLNTDNFVATRLAGFGLGTLGVNAIGFDYSMPPGTLKKSSGSSSMIRQSGPSLDAGSNLFTVFYADDANLSPVGADILDSCTATVGSGGVNARSCSISENWIDAGGGDFSMRIAQEIKVAEGQSVKTQGSLTATSAVPEPMTLSLVGVALLGVAAAARRRSTKA